ncbi:MAG: N-acetyltransferase [Rhizobiaceae bacterium]
MSSLAIRIIPEYASHDEAVEKMGAAAFGPGRFARAAFRLREGNPHHPDLSFVALVSQDGAPEVLAGSVRLTAICIGGKRALVLGPLVVLPCFKNAGIGRELMNCSILAARDMGEAFIILVGDEPYYGKFGFKVIPHGQITLPGPADPARMLYCELQPGIVGEYRGKALTFMQ